MAFIPELAACCSGEQSFTALADAAKLRVEPRADVGIATNATRAWIAAGKADASITERVVNLSRDGVFLTKLSKDRRVQVRAAVARNNATPFDVVARMRYMDKSTDVYRACEDALKRRVARMTADEAAALLVQNASERVIDLACSHAKLTDMHIQSLWDEELKVATRYESERKAKLAHRFADRADLHKFSMETLLGLAQRGESVGVVRAMRVKKDRDENALLDVLLTPNAEGRFQTAACSTLSRAEGLDQRAGERLMNAAVEHRWEDVLNGLSMNTSVAWEMFLEERVRRTTVSALGRAISSEFRDDPAVWLLASQLCDAPTTVGEVLAVLRVTHSDSMAAALGE